VCPWRCLAAASKQGSFVVRVSNITETETPNKFCPCSVRAITALNGEHKSVDWRKFAGRNEKNFKNQFTRAPQKETLLVRAVLSSRITFQEKSEVR